MPLHGGLGFKENFGARAELLNVIIGTGTGTYLDRW